MTRVETARRPGHRRAHRRRRAHPGRRRGAQPGPAGRLPRPAARPPAGRAPAALLAVLRGAARRIAPGATRKIAHHNIHFGRPWQGTFDEVIRHGRADERPVAAGHQPQPHRPVGGAGRPAHLLRARAGAQPRRGRRWTGAAASPSGTPTSSSTTLEERGYVGFARRHRGARGSSPRPTGRTPGMAAGTPFAAAHTFAQTGPFRPGNLHPTLSNVVFVGSGTQPGVGVPMVLISGKLAAGRITGGLTMTRRRETHLVELVDADGRPIGSATVDAAHQRARASCTARSRCSCATPAGRLLLQQRAAAKTRFPLRWANACCGHPAPGEDAGAAAAAAAAEELGVAGVALTEVGVYAYCAERPGHRAGRARVRPRAARASAGRTSPCWPDPDEVADLRWIVGGRPAGGARRATRGRTRPGWPAWPTLARRSAATPPSAGCDERSGRVADEALSAGAVARRLGVAVTTLRTWHQRYGLGPSQHVPGQHRRYTAEDLARLEVMRRLTAAGRRRRPRPRAWAAPECRPRSTSPRPCRRRPASDAVRGAGRGTAAATPSRSAAPGRPPAAWPAPPCAWTRPAMRDIIETPSPTAASSRAWDEVILPGAGRHRRAARGHRRGSSRSSTCSPAASPRCSARSPGRRRGRPPRVLLACADEEQHSLPLEALAAALAEARRAQPGCSAPGCRRRRCPTR